MKNKFRGNNEKKIKRQRQNIISGAVIFGAFVCYWYSLFLVLSGGKI